MEIPIGLGVSATEKYGGPLMASDKDDHDIYPQFHYSGDEELDLPQRGIMTIEYCVKREVSSVNEDGKHHYECDVAVETILSVKGEKDERPSRRDMSTEDALDTLAKAIHGDDDNEKDDEGY